ncbi:MAG: isocitrate lyase/PEP mutase family protein [Geminicoccaceae bacterium]
MPDGRLRKRIESGGFVLAPGVYDMISALIADQAGFDALYVTGYGIAASHLGLPDAGLASYTDMLSRIAQIASGTQTPIIADADTGYGGLLNIRHTVCGYEAAGVSAIQLEDQEFPKKCGHTDGRRVIAAEDMVRKLQVAREARQSEDFLIIARTDSRTSLGLDEALRRAEAYAEAGADLIFVESPESVDELKTIAARIDKPLVANMVSGGRTPVLPAAELLQIGYALAIHPGLGFLSAGEALRRGYAELNDQGIVTKQPLHDFDTFCRTMGFEDVWDFDRRWAEPTDPPGE